MPLQFGIRAQPLRVEHLIVSREKYPNIDHNNNGQFIDEGASFTRLSDFKWEDYSYWKDIIEM